MTIQEITEKYKGKIDYLDMEILIANSLSKTREFVLTYPEYKIPALKVKNLKLKISQRMSGEPIAYILGHKEFYGLDFIVNNHTLIPRPETEMIVEEVLSLITSHQPSEKITVIDIGTGSGCIITSIASVISSLRKNDNIKYIGSDISKDALIIAKKNATLNNATKKIKFLHGSLLDPILNEIKKIKPEKIIMTANLPYLSKEIYSSAPTDVKKFEPKSALYSPELGLQHYRILLEQIKNLLVSYPMLHVSCYMEISPEQKTTLGKLIKNIFPSAKIEFKKDLAKKWRICKITT